MMNEIAFWFIVVWSVLFPIALIRFYRNSRRVAKATYTSEQIEAIRARFRPMIRSGRWLGWTFFLIGSLVAALTVPPLFEPGSTITVNGEPRDDLRIKVMVSIFALAFPTFGALFAFTPASRIVDFLLGFQLMALRFDAISKGKPRG